MNSSNEEEQLNELEVLKSIYGDGVREIQNLQQGNLIFEIYYTISSMQTNGLQESIILLIECPPNYSSQVPPHFSLRYINEDLEEDESISAANSTPSVQKVLSELENELNEVALQSRESVLVFLWMQSISNYFEAHPNPIYETK